MIIFNHTEISRLCKRITQKGFSEWHRGDGFSYYNAVGHKSYYLNDCRPIEIKTCLDQLVYQNKLDFL